MAGSGEHKQQGARSHEQHKARGRREGSARSRPGRTMQKRLKYLSFSLKTSKHEDLYGFEDLEMSGCSR
jgi:hypothetical protein